MNDESKPLHEQVYQIVVESQEAQKRRDNAWRGGTDFAASTSMAAWGGLLGAVIAAFTPTEGVLELFLVPLTGVLIGGACGWLFGRACKLVFITLPWKLINAIRKK